MTRATARGEAFALFVVAVGCGVLVLRHPPGWVFAVPGVVAAILLVRANSLLRRTYDERRLVVPEARLRWGRRAHAAFELLSAAVLAGQVPLFCVVVGTTPTVLVLFAVQGALLLVALAMLTVWELRTWERSLSGPVR